MIIGLTNLDLFPLRVERGPVYYGISADTLLRGSRSLRHSGCLTVQRQRIIAPLEREGISLENCCTLNPPFGPRGRVSTAASVSR